MQEHPVPQNVTSFEFKLIGDMTLRQFGYVGTGLGIALIFFFLPINAVLFVYLIKFPVIFIAPICGFALAFLPVEGRPLDRWFVSFIKAVFGNTLYVWKKQGTEVSVLHNLPMHQIPDPSQQTMAAQVPAPTQINTQPFRKPLSPLDALEQQEMHRLNLTTQARPMPQQLQPQQLHAFSPAQPPPHTPKLAAFAGAPQPSNRFSAVPMGQMRPVGIPTVMRQPGQRPLAPKKIPLPSYQQATLHSASPQPVHIAPSAGFRPGGAGQWQSILAENQELRQRLNKLEAEMKKGIPAPTAEKDLKFLKQDDQLLHSQMATMQSMVSDYQKQLVELASDEEKYQAIITDITQKLEKSLQEKASAEKSVQTLEQETEQADSQRKALEEQLHQLQEQLTGTKSLLTEIQKQKEAPAILNQVTPQPTATAPQIELPTEPTGPTPAVTILPVAEPASAAPLPPLKPPAEMPTGPVVDFSSVKSNMPTLTTIANAISGYVYDAQQNPMMDVIVVVKKTNGPTMRALKTNRVGQFSMVSPLPDGSYEVQFEKDGYTFPAVSIEAKGSVIPSINAQGTKA